ncbi:hypothetical protein HanPI659440_Chr12g0449301 [Helianthus annuus]|nr:hypothetical protein HanPI659440_Chr12g0449301 [Helianthus annuus]
MNMQQLYACYLNSRKNVKVGSGSILITITITMTSSMKKWAIVFSPSKPMWHWAEAHWIR